MKIVISGVNLVEGGILSILIDCLSSFKRLKNSRSLEITVLIHSLNLVQDFKDDFNFIEYPQIKKSWIKRLKFEYIDSKEISKELKPDIWISLHDITPNVICDFQVVYCHNPSPFYDIKLNELLYDKTFTLFSFFYKYLYGINIKRNKYVILQQNWLRNEFKNRYGVESIVAYPKLDMQLLTTCDRKNEKFIFFYPSFPRIFKNFETLFKAIKILEQKRTDFEVIITSNGEENIYIKTKLEKCKPNKTLILKGKITREEVFNIYNNTDCLVFPSLLETWGLPLSEFKAYDKPIIAANLKYAHETVGDYHSVKFFEPENASELASLMNDAIDGTIKFDKNNIQKPNEPFFENWDDLINFLILDASKNK